MEKDVYLGDGLCASFDGWQIELYAWDGLNKTNQVYLEPKVLKAFLHYVERLKEDLKLTADG
jgi:hypothetical protein